MSAPSYNEQVVVRLPGQGGVVGQSVGQAMLLSAVDAITAFAGGGQASAVPLTGLVNRITVVATAGDSVKLPAAVAGLELYVINSDAADSLNVFPATGDTINAIAANSPFAMAAGTRSHFMCPVAGKWFTFPLVNS